ncbi:MAG: hypothetical protein PHG85_02345 [Candidatus Altiarchaeota archaeon]|nr:hypothetical protein [Candidatus Altiarchaeota archaeon]
MELNKKTIAALLLLAVLLAAAVAYILTIPKEKIYVDYTREIPEEYAFKIKAGQLVKLGEIPYRQDMKTAILRRLGLAEDTLPEGRPFNIHVTLKPGNYNTTLIGFEYSNKIFTELRPENMAQYPLIFTYKSPGGDEKTVKRYLLNATNPEIDMVGIANEITVTERAPRSIRETMRITLHNATYDTENPVETVNHRITVCSKNGC